MKCLVIGKNSFLARQLIKSVDTFHFDFLSHKEINSSIEFEKYSHIINFGCNNYIHFQNYNFDQDLDLRLFNLVKTLPVTYVMLSSRKVYQKSHQFNSNENTPTGGIDFYGANKTYIENKILNSSSKCNLLLLRPSNILGVEVDANRLRLSAFLLTQLRSKGFIYLNCNPDTRKDVISVNFFISCLLRLIQENSSGIYNLGANFSTTIKEICNAYIKGFGSGSFLTHSNEFIDEFLMCSSKMHTQLKINYRKEDLLKELVNIGRGARLS
jgi:nucleoside-diphosphate-sugar epimerase